jgi:uncharacterized membrane protein YedE/YeeE
MKTVVMQRVVAFISGLTFGVGLWVSGMTKPQKVIGFLDVFGRFDASLMFVMIGAIAVHRVAYRLKARRAKPAFSAEFAVPTRRDIDAKLVLGSLLFGVGWGLGGFCPGPAITSVVTGHPSTLAFVITMTAGIFVTAKSEALLTRRHSAPERPEIAHGLHSNPH